jgi:hypothetical protein
MTESINPNVFYWNTADDKDHTHKRIEWAIENGMLVCINIHIQDKLLANVKPGDIILAYEPKYHKISIKQFDGKCTTCKELRLDGKQAFTAAFSVVESPIIISNIKDLYAFENKYKISLGDKYWSCEIQEKKDYLKYCKDYYGLKNKTYIFPIKFISYLTESISTNKSNALANKFYYNYPLVKGFNELFCCGCKLFNTCLNKSCIYYNVRINIT